MNNLNTDLDKTNLSNPSIKTRDNMSEKSEIIIDDTLDQSSKENKIYREGYLLKITYSKRLKKLFFKLCGKHLYCNFYRVINLLVFLSN